MACTGNNATPPSPAIAPGAHDRDPRAIARALVARFGPAGTDPRLAAHIPGFDGPFFQAGLAGYSEAPMRLIARRHGCPVCVTEALLDRTLLAGGRGFAKADLGDIAGNVPGADDDHPLIGQIMGSDPAEMAAAAVKMVEQGQRGDRAYRADAYAGEAPEWFRPRKNGFVPPEETPDAEPARTFAAIDVNLACPVKKIAKKARGGHWLAQPEGAIAILRAVRDALPGGIPVTVKMRRSFDDTDEMRDNFLRIFDASYDMGCAWVCVHGRTVEQKYLGPSRWDPIRELVERRPDAPVLGSGDVWTAADIFRMIDYTGVAAVSVARGCIGNPWIFRQARTILAGREPAPPTISEQRAVLEEHFALMLADNERRMRGRTQAEKHERAEGLTGRMMRKFGVRFAAHHPEPETVKRAFTKVETLEQWQSVLVEHYEAGVRA
ncbi:MAG: tRNA-dihydrouridine synthase [Phycisphaeraceae bacterium]|nr:MAG: tRNA-dihydrouridine synthase [Phycisphaeraceae bacterium]